jgi:hypothetical protein
MPTQYSFLELGHTNMDEGASRANHKVKIELKRVKKYNGSTLAFLKIQRSNTIEASDNKLIAQKKRHSGAIPSLERMTTNENMNTYEKRMLESINISEVTTCVELKGG